MPLQTPELLDHLEVEQGALLEPLGSSSLLAGRQLARRSRELGPDGSTARFELLFGA
jgi:hypothetical protein